MLSFSYAVEGESGQVGIGALSVPNLPAGLAVALVRARKDVGKVALIYLAYGAKQGIVNRGVRFGLSMDGVKEKAVWQYTLTDGWRRIARG